MPIIKNIFNYLNAFFFMSGLLLITPGITKAEPLFASMNPKYQRIRVQEVISADMITLENDETVQLIGIKALATPKPKKIERNQYGFVVEHVTPYTSLEEKAFDFIQHLLTDQYVRLEFDNQKRGPHNILYAYVYVADTGFFVNKELLKNGFVSLSLSAPNMKYADQLREAYQTARREKKGIHGE